MYSALKTFLLSASCLLLFACSLPQVTTDQEVPIDKPTPPLVEDNFSLRDKDWVEEVNFLKNTLYTKHPRPFYATSKEILNVYFDSLIYRLPQLSDKEIIFGMQEIVALLEDAHTDIELRPSTDLCPTFILKKFQNKFYAVSSSKSILNGEAALFQQLVRINGVDIGYIEKKLQKLISEDASPYGSYWWLQRYLMSTELLAYIGVPNTQEQLVYTFIDKEGVSFEIDANNRDPNIPLETEEEWRAVYATHLAQLTQNYFYEYRKDKNILYLSYLSCAEDSQYPFSDFVTEVFTLHSKLNDVKMVIDLRNNGGGYSEVALPLYEELKKHPQLLNEKGNLYVLINGGVYSSGTWCAYQLSLLGDGITFVGSPTGGDIFGFGNVEVVTLPKSGLTLNVGTQITNDFNVKVKRENGMIPKYINAVLPDVYIDDTIEAYQAGRDLAMEWIEKQ